MIKKKGFTLIELLVVVAIIGLLATMSIIALNTARAKARDAKRVGDMKQVQTALELYFNDYNSYPPTVTFGNSIATGGVTYMGQTPLAPTPFDGSLCDATKNTYKYVVGTGATYTITYCLGGPTGGVAAGPATATPAGIK